MLRAKDGRRKTRGFLMEPAGFLCLERIALRPVFGRKRPRDGHYLRFCIRLAIVSIRSRSASSSSRNTSLIFPISSACTS